MQMFQRPPFDNSSDQWGYTASYVMYVSIRISTATMKPTTTIVLQDSCRRDRATTFCQSHILKFKYMACISRFRQQIWASLTAAHKSAFVNHPICCSRLPVLMSMWTRLLLLLNHFLPAHHRWFWFLFLYSFPFFPSTHPPSRNMFRPSFFLPGWLASDGWHSLLDGALAIHI